MSDPTDRSGTDFIRSMISRDLETGKYAGRVVTRFPPEPNGYLHIGHAKSICLNFGLAEEHAGGRCHLRFDDTNPTTEDVAFVEAIQADIRWLGFDWGEHLYFASDYFEQLHDYAVELIEKGLAYVDSSTEEEIQELRGSVTEAGRPSPYRDRSVEENLDLFRRMRAGEFEDGAHVLRAKIDMASPNMVMRDPVLVRIRHAHHYRRGDEWCTYPMYDFAHCLSDSIERITHSLCTLEFENNREIYDWLLLNTSAPEPRPEQTEFARLNLEYTVTSKRKLKTLVGEGHVRGWDDPRMPTLAGLRRKGVTPEAIRTFCDMVGVAKANSTIDLAKLDYAIRDDLNHKAPRAFAVLDPLRVTIVNYPEGETETFEAPSFPPDVGKPGSRSLPFGRELLIEAEDFSEDPPPGFRRLVPGGEVRLKYAYIIRLEEVVKDAETGRVVELRCTYDPESRGGSAPDGRKIKGTIHWVSAPHGVPATVRLFEPLFSAKDPDASDDFRDALNPRSEVVKSDAVVEPEAADVTPGSHLQFERLGYFYADPEDWEPGGPVFNRTVALRDSRPKPVKAEREDASPTEAEPGPAPSPAEAPAGPRDPRESLKDDRHLERYDDLVSHDVPPGLAVNLARDDRLYDLYGKARGHYEEGPSLAKWLVQEVSRSLGGDDEPAAMPEPAALAALVEGVDEERYSRHQGRLLLTALFQGASSLEAAEAALGHEEDDADLTEVLEGLIASFADKAEAYRGGQTGLLGFFVGQAMKETGGRADPREVSELARSLLEGA